MAFSHTGGWARHQQARFTSTRIPTPACSLVLAATLLIPAVADADDDLSFDALVTYTSSSSSSSSHADANVGHRLLAQGFNQPESPEEDPEADMVDAAVEAMAVRAPFGQADSWRWGIYGSAAMDIRRDGEQYMGFWTAEYFLVDDFSFNIDLGGGYFHQGRDDPGDAFGANLNLILRWHLVARDSYSLFVEGGAGVLGTTEEIPAGGTNFNFTPQAGFGATFALDEEKGSRLYTGVRWHHISNARIKGADDNPGRDAAMAYIGVSFPW